jgi:hypothetical protein
LGKPGHTRRLPKLQHSGGLGGDETFANKPEASELPGNPSDILTELAKLLRLSRTLGVTNGHKSTLLHDCLDSSLGTAGVTWVRQKAILK